MFKAKIFSLFEAHAYILFFHDSPLFWRFGGFLLIVTDMKL